MSEVPRRSIFFVWAMSEIFSLWVSSWNELHKLSNTSHVLRDWLTVTMTATTSTTMTSTSTTATTSTSTRLVKQFPAPMHTAGVLLGALELAFSDPLEVGFGYCKYNQSFSMFLSISLDFSRYWYIQFHDSCKMRGVFACTGN